MRSGFLCLGNDRAIQREMCEWLRLSVPISETTDTDNLTRYYIFQTNFPYAAHASRSVGPAVGDVQLTRDAAGDDVVRIVHLAYLDVPQSSVRRRVEHVDDRRLFADDVQPTV